MGERETGRESGLFVRAEDPMNFWRILSIAVALASPRWMAGGGGVDSAICNDEFLSIFHEVYRLQSPFSSRSAIDRPAPERCRSEISLIRQAQVMACKLPETWYITNEISCTWLPFHVHVMISNFYVRTFLIWKFFQAEIWHLRFSCRNDKIYSLRYTLCVYIYARSPKNRNYSSIILCDPSTKESRKMLSKLHQRDFNSWLLHISLLGTPLWLLSTSTVRSMCSYDTTIYEREGNAIRSSVSSAYHVTSVTRSFSTEKSNSLD